MKFSIWDHMSRRDDIEIGQLYEERLQLLEQADEAGLYGYFLAEHHHTPLCMAPSQTVFLAAAAQRTRRLQLGSAIFITPMYEPMRLFEEICMVDQLSGGRFEAGFSAGAGGGLEVALWNGNPAENRARLEAAVDVVIQGLSGDFITHKSEFYNYEDLWVAVPPKHKRSVPLWYGGSPAKAGAFGMRCFATHRSIEELPALRKAYLDAWEKAQSDPSGAALKGQEPAFATHRHMFIAPTQSEAYERAREAYKVLGTRWTRPLSSGDKVEIDFDSIPIDPRDLPWLSDFDRCIELEKILVGTPSSIRDHLRRYAHEGDDDHFLMSLQFGDITHEEASRSLRLFSEEVQPMVMAEAA